MELQTAKRKGYRTTLRWLKIKGRRVVALIDEKGETIKGPNMVQDLCEYYKDENGSHPDRALFAGFEWQNSPKPNTKPINERKKPKNEEKPKKDFKKKPDIKESTATMAESTIEPRTEEVTQGQVAFEKDVEVVHELIGHFNGELKYLMEFEKWDDLVYRHNKLKEKMPEYEYSFRTKRAIVTYGKLD